MGFEFLLASMVSNLCLFFFLEVFFWKYGFNNEISKGGATLIWYITEMQSGTPRFFPRNLENAQGVPDVKNSRCRSNKRFTKVGSYFDS